MNTSIKENNAIQTMKASIITEYGESVSLKMSTLTKPSITSEEVLIEVVAAGVNPVDFHIRNGMIKDMGVHTLPLVLGWDVAGIVSQIGENVKDLKVGDEVFVFAPIDKQGAYAQYISVDARLVALKPKTLNFVQSAAIPLAAVTAYQGLLRDGGLKKGQKVLIHNASGGVGGFAVQIAKNAGAYVVATASTKKEDYVRSLGADEFIDYTNTNFEEELNNIDLVFVARGGTDILEKSLDVLKSGGQMVSTLDELDENLKEKSDIKFTRMWVQPSLEDLNDIKEQIDTDKMSVLIDSVFSLETAQDAVKRSESYKAVGKIVIHVKEDTV